MRHSALLCQPAPRSDPSVELRGPSCKQRRLAPPEAPGCQDAVPFAVLAGWAGLAGGREQCLGTGVRLCRTPLHLACANGHADVVRFLAGKKCKLNPHGMYKKTPLMLAVQHQHKDCVTALLEHGADADHKGAGGNTALHMAALMPSKAMVELLLEHNAQIDARNDLGYTPLAVAIIERREEMVEFLLQNGADVNARDIQQRTPLQIAGYAGNTNVVRLLLQHGAVLSHRDQDGFTNMGYLDHFTPGFSKALQEYGRSKRAGECSVGGAGGAAVPEISSSGMTAASPVGAAAQTGGGVLPEAGAEQEEDFDSLSDFEVSSLKVGSDWACLLFGSFPSAAASDSGLESQHHLGRNRPLRSSSPTARLALPMLGNRFSDKISLISHLNLSWNNVRLALLVLLLHIWQKGLTQMPNTLAVFGIFDLSVPHYACWLKRELCAWRRVQKESVPLPTHVFSFPQTDSEGPMALLDAVLLPGAKQQGVCAHPVAEERHNGVLPAAGAAQEEEEDFDFSSLDEDFALGREELPLKKEASTQTDGQGDTQERVRWLQQELASALRKCSLAEASLEAEKRNSRELQEQKLQLQKELDSSKAQLQELKERLIRNERYGESLESAVKNKEKELTASKNMQRPLVKSSGTAAAPQLEERLQQLQVGMARLAATAQQQAKTVEALQQDLQASSLLSLQRHEH
ncbi:uncharacterized protein [Patagioenas fasciata]|uniref:uncharacterized protein n=1 Tax=Patagioenas fasciata TaxID=372321 RepID=UPI003A996D01